MLWKIPIRCGGDTLRGLPHFKASGSIKSSLQRRWISTQDLDEQKGSQLPEYLPEGVNRHRAIDNVLQIESEYSSLEADGEATRWLEA